MTPLDISIKTKLNDWINDLLSRSRQAGKKLNRTDLALLLGCTTSCLSQYTNPSNKKAPIEFQIKVSLLTGHSIIELHPDYEVLRIQHF